jgi:ring-1,2-phenylacetyl-CoA epoxidase subunit PaaE
METYALRVVAILPEALDTKTIFLERTDGQPVVYQAGQFLTLLFQIHGHELRRSYSFSTTPGIDPIPAITVKRIPNGEISRFLLDHLQPGDTLTTLPPAGRFTLEPMPAPDPIGFAGATAQPAVPGAKPSQLFFLAAGSGLIPIFSLIKKAVTTEPPARITIITQQHEPASSPFREQLTQLQAAYGPITFEWIDLLSVQNGRINHWWLQRWLETTGAITCNTRFYLCGPEAFMRMSRFTLKMLGIPEDHIKQEHFTVDRRPPPPPPVDTAPKTITILTAAGRNEFETAWPDTILDAALKHGIRLPYSCRAGRCSTCVARLIQGKIKMSTNEVLTEKDIQEGLTLTCVGYAETNVTLSF